MSNAMNIPSGMDDFQPDSDAWSRYGALVEATCHAIDEAARLAPALTVHQPISTGLGLPATSEQSSANPPIGYEARGAGDMCDLIANLVAGKTTATAEVEQSISRIKDQDGALFAMVEVEAERAIEQASKLDVQSVEARGPLAGAPYARKDLLFRTGRPVECGSTIFTGQVADQTATVLNRLDEAGGIDIGRLSMAEIAMSPTGFNAHHEHPRNPWNTDYVPGGSSSGSGVAVAAGYVAAALGTDTGGSIRHPAAMCGVTGLKPTANRISRAGAWPLAWSLDCIGPLARSARDCALLLEIMSGPDPNDSTVTAAKFQRPPLTGDLSGKRIAVPSGYYFETVTPVISKALDTALAELKTAGADIVKTGTPDMATVNMMLHLVIAAEACSHLGHMFRDPECKIGRQVRDRLEPGMFYSAGAYANALRLRSGIRSAWLHDTMADCDAVFIPAIPREVPTIAETTDGDLNEIAAKIGALTHATRGINYLGLPALSVPCGFDANGLPIGFQLVARPNDEATLIQIGDAYQQATDWHTRRPAERTS